MKAENLLALMRSACLPRRDMQAEEMRFDYAFIGFGVLAGAALAFLGPVLPAQFKAFPPLLWLLASVLLFDIITAYIRGVPVMQSVSTNTRVIAFLGGAVVMILSGGLWS